MIPEAVLFELCLLHDSNPEVMTWYKAFLGQ